LSAALLQSDPKSGEPAPVNPDPLTELQELNAEVERLAWKMENAIKRLTRDGD
jgi:hypothetical protein